MTRRRRVNRIALGIAVSGLILSVSCVKKLPGSGERQPLSSSTASAVRDSVRRFVLRVAQDVTRDGPSAWRSNFEEGDTFFMVAEGHLVFPSGDSATRAIADLEHLIKSIDLRWEAEPRVDALTPDLAEVAVPFHELRTDWEGRQAEEEEMFTALAEFRSGSWKFRNAQWSRTNPGTAVK